MAESNSNWMDALPPRVLFLGGLIGGVLVLCTIGFFILLGMKLSGPSEYSANYAGSDTANAPSGNTGDTAAAPAGKPAEVAGDEHIYGNKNAKITLVEYSDLQCPFCNQFHPTAKRLVDESKGTVRLVYRHFPLSSIHPFAQKAAEAAECVTSAAGNTAFWKFADAVFANQANLSDAMLLNTAAQAGANRAAVDACIKSGKFAGKVRAMESEGEKIGVQGTPATFVVAADGSTEMMPGALTYDSAKAYVDRATAK